MSNRELGPVVGALTTACAVAGSILTNPKPAATLNGKRTVPLPFS